MSTTMVRLQVVDYKAEIICALRTDADRLPWVAMLLVLVGGAHGPCLPFEFL